MALRAVVLAGGPADDVSALQPGAINKTFVRVGGISLVERTLRGLRSASAIGEIIAVAPRAAHGDPALALADERRDDGERIAQSLRSGTAGLPPDDLVAIAAADLPFLDGPAVDDFFMRSADRSADVVYGIVERRTHLAAYPNVRHTWAHLRDGTYCGGGLFAIRPRALGSLERFLDELGLARKNPLRLAAIFGYDILLRYALRRLTVADAEARASALLGLGAAAVVSPYAQTAFNVDRPADVAAAEAFLTRSRSSA